MTTIETPSPYGWNPTPEHIARVQANLREMEAQRARRRAATADNPNRSKPRTVHLSDVVWDWARDYAAGIGTSVSHVIETRLVDLHDDVEAHR